MRTDEAIARLEIQSVLWTYARGVDRADYETMRSVYHPDAIDHHAHFDGPGDEFASDFTTRHAADVRVGTHHITNVLIELDDENNARVESYFLAFHPHGAGTTPPLGIAAGRYLDHFQRRETGWKILDRQVVMDWTRDDIPAGPWLAAEGRPIRGRTKHCGDQSYLFFA